MPWDDAWWTTQIRTLVERNGGGNQSLYLQVTRGEEFGRDHRFPASATPTVSVAASDFYGPGVRNAHAGERLVPTVLGGRTMRVLGSLDQPHSFTYMADLAAAMIIAAGRQDLWNSFLHAPTAPPPTQRRLVEMVAAAGGVRVPRMSAIPAGVLGAAGLFSREMRELAETSYMFSRPFVLDSSASEERLGLSPTPVAAGLAETVAWWRRQERAAA